MIMVKHLLVPEIDRDLEDDDINSDVHCESQLDRILYTIWRIWRWQASVFGGASISRQVLPVNPSGQSQQLYPHPHRQLRLGAHVHPICLVGHVCLQIIVERVEQQNFLTRTHLRRI